jgi:tRNA(Arg) A34 adenosine deaminase TadA
MQESLPYMWAAIEQAREGGTPFGCVIVKKDVVVVSAHNTVAQDLDVTAHAEINALRKLHAQKKKVDLSGYVLYTTCEPCPMCMSAILYAGITTVVYGASITQARQYVPQIEILSHDLAAKSPRKVLIIPGMLHTECLHLFEEFPQKKS